MKIFIIFLIIFNCCLVYAKQTKIATRQAKMVRISGGNFTPFFSRDKDGKAFELKVPAFFIDISPVTNKDYLQFVRQHKKWQRNKVKLLFADKNYLQHWSSHTSLDKKQEHEPVRYISWFAALAYCESLGKTLPTVLQWEFVASADETDKMAIKKDSYKKRILEWYSKPNPKKISDVKKSSKNVWGVYDLHGLVWEWNLDYNTALVTGESREDSVLDKNRFCGSGSLNAKDKLDYGAFMRFGYRSALKGSNTAPNLGFRCAKNIGGTK